MSGASVDNLVVGFINLEPVQAVRRTGSYIYFNFIDSRQHITLSLSLFLISFQDPDNHADLINVLTSCVRSLERAMIGPTVVGIRD